MLWRKEFIKRALHFDDLRIVAMLLRTDFDHAASRAHLFGDCAMFEGGSRQPENNSRPARR